MDWNSDGVGCFDPLQIVARMRVAFPELKCDERDHLLDTCKTISRAADGESAALRAGVKDLYERGPVILFEIPYSSGRTIKGVVERYVMRVSSDEPLPDKFVEEFTSFLESLKLQEIEITKEV